nr:transposase [Micromonospora tarapacensis]
MQVAPGGKGLVGHAGAILLRRCADRTGLTSGLNKVLPRGKGPGWWDRGTVLICLATSIVLGATSMSDIRLLARQVLVFADPPSEATVRRTLTGLDETTLGQIAKARAKVRARVWALLARRPQGFPWLAVAGKVLTGWVVIDLDATLITAHSDKENAAAMFKRGFGFHPLGAWCANTTESLAMLLRPGNAGSNTVTDHIRVLGEAIAQLPVAYRRKILIRVDGAGATHDLLEHRAHAIIEQVNADLIGGPLAHLPSGRFNANDAWLTCAAIAHNLTRASGHLAAGPYATARPATIRTRIINLAARLAHRARTTHLHLPQHWPWQTAFENLFTAAHTAPG